MNGFARAWGAILPLRWYLQVLFDQAARGAPPSDSVRPFMVLGGLACLYFFLAWLRLRAIANDAAPSPGACDPACARRPRRRHRLSQRGDAHPRRPVRVRPDRPRADPLWPPLSAALSRRGFAQPADRGGRPGPDGTQPRFRRGPERGPGARRDGPREHAWREAKAALDRHDVYAIVAIPKDTERQVLRGEQARIAAYVDAAYLLLYSQTLQGISEAAATASAAVALRGARIDGSLAHAALVRTSPVESVSEPLFNPTGGYAAYVVPAAFVLILQQTLAARRRVDRRGGVRERRARKPPTAGGRARRLRPGARASVFRGSGPCALSDRAAARLRLLDPRAARGSRPAGRSVRPRGQLSGAVRWRMVQAPRDGGVAASSRSACRCSFWSACPGRSRPSRTSSARAAAPSPAPPPSTRFVRINQMGASILEVRRDWITLWVLAVVYGLLAVAATRIANRKRRKS